MMSKLINILSNMLKKSKIYKYPDNYSKNIKHQNYCKKFSKIYQTKTNVCSLYSLFLSLREKMKNSFLDFCDCKSNIF